MSREFYETFLFGCVLRLTRCYFTHRPFFKASQTKGRADPIALDMPIGIVTTPFHA
jgi:hypothetical protein